MNVCISSVVGDAGEEKEGGPLCADTEGRASVSG